MTKSLELNITSISDLPMAAKSLLEFAGKINVFLFEASMGAGKTTLIKELCKQLGSHDDFSSPTYAIVNEYLAPKGKIFHFDLFRLKDQNELVEIGVDDYLKSKQYCFVEWPELMLDFIDEAALHIEIVQKDQERLLKARVRKV